MQDPEEQTRKPSSPRHRQRRRLALVRILDVKGEVSPQCPASLR